MKLYYARAACSLVVRIIINELNLTCEYEAVDLKEKKTEKGKNYFDINPKGAVPALEIKAGEVLTENAVILQYLADTHHASTLLQAIGDFNRYRTLEWLNYITTELHKSFGVLFNANISQDVKDKVLIPALKAKFSYLDKQLENRSYLQGNHFTLPDAYLYVMLRWAEHFKFEINTWSNLEKYFLELKKRNSIIKSLKEENL
jgi:glutathione S-transferase